MVRVIAITMKGAMILIVLATAVADALPKAQNVRVTMSVADTSSVTHKTEAVNSYTL